MAWSNVEVQQQMFNGGMCTPRTQERVEYFETLLKHSADKNASEQKALQSKLRKDHESCGGRPNSALLLRIESLEGCLDNLQDRVRSIDVLKWRMQTLQGRVDALAVNGTPEADDDTDSCDSVDSLDEIENMARSDQHPALRERAVPRIKNFFGNATDRDAETKEHFGKEHASRGEDAALGFLPSVSEDVDESNVVELHKEHEDCHKKRMALQERIDYFEKLIRECAESDVEILRGEHEACIGKRAALQERISYIEKEMKEMPKKHIRCGSGQEQPPFRQQTRLLDVLARRGDCSASEPAEVQYFSLDVSGGCKRFMHQPAQETTDKRHLELQRRSANLERILSACDDDCGTAENIQILQGNLKIHGSCGDPNSARKDAAESLPELLEELDCCSASQSGLAVRVAEPGLAFHRRVGNLEKMIQESVKKHCLWEQMHAEQARILREYEVRCDLRAAEQEAMEYARWKRHAELKGRLDYAEELIRDSADTHAELKRIHAGQQLRMEHIVMRLEESPEVVSGDLPCNRSRHEALPQEPAPAVATPLRRFVVEASPNQENLIEALSSQPETLESHPEGFASTNMISDVNGSQENEAEHEDDEEDEECGDDDGGADAAEIVLVGRMRHVSAALQLLLKKHGTLNLAADVHMKLQEVDGWLKEKPRKKSGAIHKKIGEVDAYMREVAAKAQPLR